MKVTLTFELPEEDEAFREHLDGWKAFSALRDMDNWLRAEIKYKKPERVKLSSVREKLGEIIQDLEIKL
jgi:hypothetical protein